jgi:hypothetical protein
MKLRDRFNGLRQKAKATSPSATPSEMPVNGCFQVPRGLLGKAVPMLPISSRIDTPDNDDVLRALLVRESKPRKRALRSSADLPRLVMKRLMQNMARSEKTSAR